jgi:hypothetical protein
MGRGGLPTEEEWITLGLLVAIFVLFVWWINWWGWRKSLKKRIRKVSDRPPSN